MTSLAITPETRIAVLCGGASAEREISLRSGQAISDALGRLGYQNVQLLDIQPGLALLETFQQARPEVAFLALHGTMAEDGAIHGLLNWLQIPFTGSSLSACAVSINKPLSKLVLERLGLPVVMGYTMPCPFNVADTVATLRENPLFAMPWMVKPANQGSSVGMNRVDSYEDLAKALEAAQSVELADSCKSTLPQVFLEPFVEGVDVTVGVIDINGQPTVTPALMLKPKNGGWYDEVAKYTEGATEFLVPAPLPEAVTTSIQQAAITAHIALGCHGVSRTDFLVSGLDTQTPLFYLLELNAIPGMTTLSDLPAQAQAMGISFDELVNLILQTAVKTKSAVAALAT
jgi:D-alanine--D-alanine ligase